VSRRLQLCVAVLLEGRVAVEVQTLRLALGDRRLGRIAPHVTLAPPSAVPEPDLAGVVAALHRAARVGGPFGCALGPPTTFLPATPTVHLPVGDPDGRLAALRNALADSPLRRDRRPFSPHVTLVSGLDAERIAAACTLLAGYTASMQVERLSLLVRPPDAAGWTVLDDVDLDGVRTAGSGVTALEFAAGTVAGPSAAELVGGAAGLPPLPEAPGPGDVPNGMALVVTARRAGEVVAVAWGGDSERPDAVVVAPAVRGEGIGRQVALEWSFRRRRRDALDR
jgi:2'-5' RNA ligase